MIKIENVSQSFQKKVVLNDVNLVVNKNERCALVGRNGAGKSTLIHLMLGLLPLKKGTITLDNYNNKTEQWKKSVSYLPEKFHLYPHLTGYENIVFFGSLINKKIDEELVKEKLKIVSLLDDCDKRVKGYSKGMLQRLGLAIILYYDTDIIILDEPTSGLDPIGREEILSILQSLEDKTILMASHHFSEIKQVCSHVAYLNDGKITKYPVEQFYEEIINERSSD